MLQINFLQKIMTKEQFHTFLNPNQLESHVHDERIQHNNQVNVSLLSRGLQKLKNWLLFRILTQLIKLFGIYIFLVIYVLLLQILQMLLINPMAEDETKIKRKSKYSIYIK